MQHRYIVWQGHYRGRHFKEMHIINHNNKPICGIWKPKSAIQEDIWKGRPDGYSLCRNCSRHRERFEQAERLRTWQALAETE